MMEEVSDAMLIDTACSLALYCQRCGKIHVQELPYFSGTGRRVLHCADCGHEQAALFYGAHGSLRITVGCAVCGSRQDIDCSLLRLSHLQLDKIYCRQDSFELGYIGSQSRIRELLEFNQAEFEALHPSDGKNFIAQQQLLLAAVNQVHDIARQGNLSCSCGSRQIMAGIEGNSLILECAACGRYYLLRAGRAADFARLEKDFAASSLPVRHCWQNRN